MKNFFLILPICFLLACHHDTAVNKVLLKADLDTAYNNASDIRSISLDSEKIHSLINLGMLWGFIKYYHASVNQGNFNMDAELFRVLPKVLAAHNATEANTVMEQWVDHFGVPDICKSCRDITRNSSTKLMPDYGYLFDAGNFPASLIGKLGFIKQNRYAGSDHYYIGMAKYISNPVFENEKSYINIAYPDAGIRLLALYRYWNMIQYFFPNRHLIGEDWNKVLAEFIPVFCNARDTLAYELAAMELIARIHDTHANLWMGGVAIEEMKGDYTAPFKATFIENKLVVTEYYADSFPVKNILQIGDVISKIDGILVPDIVKKYLPLAPASNYSAQLHELAKSSGFLLRNKKPVMHLQIERNAKLFDIFLPAIKYNRNNNTDLVNDVKFYHLIDGNIGYIFPQTLIDADFDIVKKKFKDTKGIIIDMRCYPGTFMPYLYGAWLMPRSPFAIITAASIDMPGLFEITKPSINGSYSHSYNGRIVIIVNQETISQAEFTVMALSKVPGATVIGDTTAGADGDISTIVLPGGLLSWISGIGIFYPDGTESQRLGVKIDHFIAPTIAGVRQRRDEQLEYAIKLINGK